MRIRIRLFIVWSGPNIIKIALYFTESIKKRKIPWIIALFYIKNPVDCRISLHSCHQELTPCVSLGNGWKESCHRPFSPVTRVISKTNGTNSFFEQKLYNFSQKLMKSWPQKLFGEGKTRRWQDSCHPFDTKNQQVMLRWQEWKEIRTILWF